MSIIDQVKQQKQLVRRSADIIALTAFVSIVINYLLYPLEQYLPHFAEGTFFAQLNELILYVIIFALPFTVASKLSGMRFTALLGTEKPSPSVYVMAIGLTMGWSFIAGFLSAGIEIILNIFHLTEPVQPYILPQTGAALLVQIIATAIVPPVVEELCYRGFFLNTALSSMGTWGAIIFIGFAFWLAHYSITILPLAFGFSVIGGYMRLRYGSLLPSMCGHFLVNSVYLIINISFAQLNSQTAEMITGTVYLVQILSGVIGVVLFLRKGCLSEIKTGAFGYHSALSPQQMVSAVLTSIPVWVILCSAVYFTAAGLEVF